MPGSQKIFWNFYKIPFSNRLKIFYLHQNYQAIRKTRMSLSDCVLGHRVGSTPFQHLEKFRKQQRVTHGKASFTQATVAFQNGKKIYLGCPFCSFFCSSQTLFINRHDCFSLWGLLIENSSAFWGYIYINRPKTI